MLSAPFESHNLKNPRHALFRGIGVTAVAEFDRDLQPLRGRQRRVVARVGLIGVREVGKYPRRLLHARIIAGWVRLQRGAGGTPMEFNTIALGCPFLTFPARTHSRFA